MHELQVIRTLGTEGVEVRSTAAKGKGLYATQVGTTAMNIQRFQFGKDCCFSLHYAQGAE